MAVIDNFLGINNTTDPQKLPLGTLSKADNVMLTATGSVKRRKGSSQIAIGTKITGSYGTSDNRFMFLIDNGSLLRFDGDGFISLANGLPVMPSFWCEESTNRVLVISGGAFLQIDGGGDITALHNMVLPQDTGINDLALNTELTPTSGVVSMAFHQGSVVLALRLEDGLTRVQFSIPGEYYLYHTINNRFEIPDDILCMESVNGQLVIACRHSIYSYSINSGLSKLAEYGTVPGKSISKLPENGCYIWTTRGVCSYPEFKNLTEQVVSLPAGNGCSTTVQDISGERYFLICNDGAGVAYNSN